MILKINTSLGTVSIIESGNIKSSHAVIFIHGNSCSSATFQKQMDSHLLVDHHLIAIDIPGHGLSEHATNPEMAYKMQSIIDTLIEVIDKLGLNDFIICAHSFGGHVAIQSLPKLKNCRGLMIFCTPPIASLASLASAFLPNPAYNTLFQQHPSDQDIDILVNEFTSDIEVQQLLKHTIINTDPNFRKVLGVDVGIHFTSAAYIPETEILANTQIPIMIVHGETEKMVNHEYISQLNIPTLFNHKIFIINNSCHFPQMENAEAFDKNLLQFATHCFNPI
ncbi:MAG: alpha/beta hydrolase [Cytophagales bacterium]|nr:alpha/beta hydrolase [Cytophagales bacterium]